MADRIAGSVKWYEELKSYGWLKGDDGVEYHVHRSEIEGKVVLEEGERVTFAPSKNAKGPRARVVRREP